MEAINRQRLYSELGFLCDKIPPETKGVRFIPLRDHLGNVLFHSYVQILPAKGKKSHRLLVKCIKCGKWLPFGRMHQHVDSETCKQNIKVKI